MGYGLNIAASLTAFLVGVPVASVVLETMTSNRVEKMQRESVNRISAVAWKDFANAIHDLCSDERINAVAITEDDSSPAGIVQEEHNLIIETLGDYRYAMGKNPDRVEKFAKDLKIFLAEHLSEFESKLETVDKQFGHDYEIRTKWNYILSLWQVLDSHIRLRRMEFGLEPMDQRSYTAILDDLMSGENPIFEFLSEHSGRHKSDGPIRTMSGLRTIMDALLQVPDSRVAV